MRVILIDDEPIGLDTLQVMIERLNLQVQIIASTTNPKEGIELIDKLKPDAVFLDINMPEIDGIQLVEKLKYKDFKLVYTTAHSKYAIDAIKQKAFDYLLKPIDAEELKSCVEKMTTELKILITKQRKFIELNVNDGVLFIKQDNIIRIMAEGSYCNIFLKDGKNCLASKNLKYLEALLDPNSFFRCHQSHLINLKEITKLLSQDGYKVLMSDGSTAEVSKRCKDELLSKMKVI
jgi:two-component system LytT family response regulator